MQIFLFFSFTRPGTSGKGEDCMKKNKVDITFAL